MINLSSAPEFHANSCCPLRDLSIFPLLGLGAQREDFLGRDPAIYSAVQLIVLLWFMRHLLLSLLDSCALGFGNVKRAVGKLVVSRRDIARLEIRPAIGNLESVGIPFELTGYPVNLSAC